MTRSIALRGAFAPSILVVATLAACGGGSGSSGTNVSNSGGNGCEVNSYGMCVGNSGPTFGGAGGGEYIASALVSDTTSTALHTDADLVNAWGLAFNPSGFAWVANAGTGTSTLYDGDGVQQTPTVQMPSGTGGVEHPAGIVYNGSSSAFMVTSGSSSGAAAFLFATLEGQIAAWSPHVSATQAINAVDDSASGATYTGLALAQDASGPLIYAADFAHGHVTVFNAQFAPVTTTGGFTDPTLPAGYAPFGIQAIGTQVYVSYAQPGTGGQHETLGAGLGLVDVFDTQGNLKAHLVPAGGALNAPWGMALAPANFGKFSNMLLVGNFGDGTIHAFDLTTGAPQGAITNDDGSTITIDGLWALQFGTGLNSQPANTLFYTAGPASETHGLYGRIDMN